MGAPVAEGETAAPTAPSAPLYESSRIFEFQADGAARAYLRPGSFAIWSTGIGKSHLAMMVAALLFEDDKIDAVLLCCETNKLSEWLGDFRLYTKLDAVLYRGTKDRRRNILAEGHQVYITTYETARNDLAERIPGRAKKLKDSFLCSYLKDKRVLVVYDEATKLRDRSSGNYRHQEHLLRQLRKSGEAKVVALTGTPFEKSPESAFNIGRLVMPDICTVKQFEEDHIAGYDYFGNVTGYKNIGADDHVEPWVVTLYDKLAPCLLVKDKNDEDVRDQFPRQVEEFAYIELPPKLRDFYNEVLDLGDDADLPGFGGGIPMVLRQVLLHPMALTHSSGKAARAVVEAVTVDGLRALPVPKRDLLIEDLTRVVREEGRKAVVFTFFGQSVLHCLHHDLVEAGFNVVTNHGGMEQGEREEGIARFRHGDAEVLLSSDAGSKGINLPEATVVINYELPTLASTYTQRIDRVHRIDSGADMVWARSYIAKDTIEEALAAVTLERNAWFDSFVSRELAAGTKAYRMSAREREILMKISREAAEES